MTLHGLTASYMITFMHETKTFTTKNLLTSGAILTTGVPIPTLGMYAWTIGH